MSTVRHALSELASHPGRATLNAIGLLVGVLAVVGIVGSGSVVGSIAIGTAEQLNGRSASYSVPVEAGAISAADVESFLSATAPVGDSGGAVALLITTTEPTAIGTLADSVQRAPLHRTPVTFVWGDLSRIRRLPVLQGAAEWGDASFPPHLVLNRPAAELWGGVGTELVVMTGGHPPVRVIVSGVIADGDGQPGYYLAAAPFLTLPGGIRGAQAEVTLQHPSATAEAMFLAATQGASAASWVLDAPSFHRTDTVEQAIASIAPQQTAFAIAAVIGLFTAGLGILNIGIASVDARTRELVIRRALGATRGSVLGALLLAAILVAAIASAAAAAITILIVQFWAPTLIPASAALDPPAIPWTALGVGTLVACATTLLSSTLPAIVAARLDVAAALRD